jgi:hypothetical protein
MAQMKIIFKYHGDDDVSGVFLTYESIPDHVLLFWYNRVNLLPYEKEPIRKELERRKLISADQAPHRNP